MHSPILSGSKILGMAAKPVFIQVDFPFQSGLNMIRTQTHLAPLSIFVDVIEIVAILIVMAEDFLQYVKNTPNLEAFTGFSMIPYDVGVTIYTFEGVGMVLPLELVADQKHKFGLILGPTMFIIAITFDAFGILGYYEFGSETRDIITSNMG